MVAAAAPGRGACAVWRSRFLAQVAQGRHPSRLPAVPAAWRALVDSASCASSRPGRPYARPVPRRVCRRRTAAAASLLRAVVSSTCANCAACACSARSTEVLATATCPRASGVDRAGDDAKRNRAPERVTNSTQGDHGYPRPSMPEVSSSSTRSDSSNSSNARLRSQLRAGVGFFLRLRPYASLDAARRTVRGGPQSRRADRRVSLPHVPDPSFPIRPNCPKCDPNPWRASVQISRQNIVNCAAAASGGTGIDVGTSAARLSSFVRQRRGVRPPTDCAARGTAPSAARRDPVHDDRCGDHREHAGHSPTAASGYREPAT